MNSVERASGTKEPAWLAMIDKVVSAGVIVSGFLTAFMALQIVVDVFSRNLFNKPVPGTIEMVQYWWMPAIAYLAIGYAQLTDRQIRVILLLESTKPRHARMAELISEILCGGLVLIMIYLGVFRALASFETQESALVNSWIVIWPGRTVVVLGLVMILLAAVARITRLLQMRTEVLDESGTPSFSHEMLSKPEETQRI